MTTVYLVSVGEYSDYRIEGIFSTAEKATEFMGGRPDKFNETKEVVLDSEPPCKWMTEWKVYLTKEGALFEPWKHAVYNRPEGYTIQGNMIPLSELQSGRAALGFHPDNVYRLSSEFGWFLGISHTSFEHAIQLAQEFRETTLQQHPEWFTDAQ